MFVGKAGSLPQSGSPKRCFTRVGSNFAHKHQTKLEWRYDNQHIDIQHNDTQHNDTQHNDTQHNDTQHNDTQHNNTLPCAECLYTECRILFTIMLSVITLNIVMLSAVLSARNSYHGQTLQLITSTCKLRLVKSLISWGPDGN